MTGPRDTSLVVYCKRHPDTETALRCSRCEDPICPRCLVYTPVGARCPDCAHLRRPPMYELSAGHYLRAAGAALVVAILLGLAGGIILPPVSRTGLLYFGIAFLGGIGAGAMMAGAMDRATRGKRGPVMQGIAVGALAIAAVLRLVVSGEIDEWNQDVAGALLLIAAVVSSWGRLR